jgi:hypothetical protein
MGSGSLSVATPGFGLANNARFVVDGAAAVFSGALAGANPGDRRASTQVRDACVGALRDASSA